jgi:hypothetical protein
VIKDKEMDSEKVDFKALYAALALGKNVEVKFFEGTSWLKYRIADSGGFEFCDADDSWVRDDVDSPSQPVVAWREVREAFKCCTEAHLGRDTCGYPVITFTTRLNGQVGKRFKVMLEEVING